MTISCVQAEVEKLFVQLELKNATSVCLTAVTPGSGTTSLAMALYERYLLAGYRTLYVDFNLDNPSFIQSIASLNLIAHKTSSSVFAGLIAPTRTAEQLRYRDPSALQQTLDNWQGDYQRVVIDCAAMGQAKHGGIHASLVASCTAATLVVVKAGHCSAASLENALQELTSSPFVSLILNQFTLQSLAEAILQSRLIGKMLGAAKKQKLSKLMENYSIFQQVI